MTNEKAIETLKQLILQGTDERLKNDYEAIDLAIKALETGEIYMTGEDYNLYMKGYKAGKKDFAPKQGYWKPDYELHQYVCSECGNLPTYLTGRGVSKDQLDNHYFFCRFCGADMRGEHNE